MKTIFPKSYFLLFIVILIPSDYMMAQEGNDLITAVAYQDLDKVKNLVEAGVDINYQEESAGATALIMSAMYNFGDIARYLIEKGADISIKNNTGHTALMASAGSSVEVFDLLVANGADMSVKLEDGMSAFTLSISGVMSDFVGLGNAKKLLENGADVDESFTSGPDVLPHVNLGWSNNFLWNSKISGTVEDIMRFEVVEFFETNFEIFNNVISQSVNY